MAKTISLVKSKAQAFQLGLMAENIDPSQRRASSVDQFILTEPAPSTEKVDNDKLIDKVMMVFHRYSNIQGKDYHLLVKILDSNIN